MRVLKMIFNPFIKRHYQHPDPQKRLAAVARLEPHKRADKSKLHELAFNDNECEVSIAALNRLDSFPLWLKMSEIAAHPVIKRFARQKVDYCLFDESSSLPLSQRRQTVLESKNRRLCEKALHASTLFDWNDSERIHILEVVADENIILAHCANTNSEIIKQWLLCRYNKHEALSRLLSNQSDDEFKKRIRAKMADIKASQQLSEKLQKSFVLALSKLNMLKESENLEKLQSDSQQLRDELADLQLGITRLSKKQQQQNQHKLEQILSQVNAQEDKLRRIAIRDKNMESTSDNTRMPQ